MVRLSCALVALCAVGCGGSLGDRRDSGGLDAAGAMDAATQIDASTQPTLAVGHTRELRGVWVASVYNIDFPRRTGLTAEQARAELESMLDLMSSLHLNAIVFQVRPESDALYASELEPWSRFLTATQGGDPGWDPLGLVIELAHARGIEVHAWINPYRAKVSSDSTAVAPHLTITMPQHAITYGTSVVMNPGAPEVRAHVVAVIRDIVRRYDVDGIHFDDYFYPYPISGETFDDAATYAAYQASGGTLSLGDWRRDNVHQLVSAAASAIAAEKPWVRFGISPFGIYRPGMPAGISGLDAYSAIYCDSLHWLREGWVDYLAPQLYWPTTQTAQAYGALVAWWSDRAFENGRYLFAGNSIANLGTSSAWTSAEIEEQIRLSRALADRNSLGNVFFSMRHLVANREGIADAFRANVYTAPALPPPLTTAPDGAPAPPRITLGSEIEVTHDAIDTVRAFSVYRVDAGVATLDFILTGEPTTLTLPSGTWAIAAVDRFDRESRGALIEVP